MAGCTSSGAAADLVITGGENVRPGEVEAQLLSHPRVEAACVVGLEDDEWGQVVAAAVVGGASETELRDWLRPRLAAFKIPRQLLLCEQLPMSPQLKVDRRAVARLLGSAR